MTVNYSSNLNKEGTEQMKLITVEQVLNRTLVVDATPEQLSDIESGKLVLNYCDEDYAIFKVDGTKEEVHICIDRMETEYCEHFPEVLCIDGEEVV